MSKGWRIIGGLVLMLVLLGALCIGVGFMTGGDIVEVYTSLNDKYQLSGIWDRRAEYVDWGVTAFQNIVAGVRGLF
ncbi:MAG: hypothetical protein IKH34_10655 [Oscillospiraceae bacterium]|nr:hypothetical protein [Oscillospiraceae bacterium]